MGRRKIEIQPITHERNRSVTFLKRKNGLFKKAYELGVLCSVDVVVIIFDEKPGQPGTQKLYEYSSSKVKDIIKKHSKYTGERDSKGPGDFSRGGGKGGGGKIDEDSDAEGDEDNEEDEEEEEPPEPPKKRQRKSAPTTSTKATASSSAKHASQASTSLKRDRSPAPTTPQSRATTPDLRPPEPPAVPSGYLQHQSQNHAAQYHHPHSNLANSSFDAYHPQTQYHQHTQYQPQLPFQNRPLQQTQYPPSYGGKYQHQNQMYGPSYRHLFDNQNPNSHNSSSFNDLLSIFEAMPSNANNPHSNGLSLPVGGGMENIHAAWPENPGLYQQQQRGGGGGGVGGPNNWLDYLSGSGNQGRRPAVGEELIGVFQGAPARRGQTSTPDEDVDEADREGGRSGSTSDSEYEPHREFSSSRRKGRGKKG